MGAIVLLCIFVVGTELIWTTDRNGVSLNPGTNKITLFGLLCMVEFTVL